MHALLSDLVSLQTVLLATAATSHTCVNIITYTKPIYYTFLSLNRKQRVAFGVDALLDEMSSTLCLWLQECS